MPRLLVQLEHVHANDLTPQFLWFLVDNRGVLKRSGTKGKQAEFSVSLCSDSFAKQDAAEYHPDSPADILR